MTVMLHGDHWSLRYDPVHRSAFLGGDARHHGVRTIYLVHIDEFSAHL